MRNNKSIWILVAAILILLGLALYFSPPKDTDWSHKLYNTKTEPYGTYIVYELLEDLFPQKKIKTTRNYINDNVIEILGSDISERFKDPNATEVVEIYSNEDDLYEEEDDIYEEDTADIEIDTYRQETIKETQHATIYNDEYEENKNKDLSDQYLLDKYAHAEAYTVFDTTTYVFVATDFYPDRYTLPSLFDFVGVGNNVFIASEYLNDTFIERLGLKTSKTKGHELAKDSLYSLTQFTGYNYHFDYLNTRANFDSIATAQLTTEVLGVNGNNDPIFIRVQYGYGNFYLHLAPIAFTNINVLDRQKSDFAFRSLSYIPRTHHILWDEGMKQGYNYNNKRSDESMFQIIFRSQALTWAFYLTLVAFALFMIFRAKRIQRIIPIIVPAANTTIEFLDTIANMYYKKKAYKASVVKRHAYFLDYIRKNYYESTETINELFITHLSAKTGVDRSILFRVFDYYNQIDGADSITLEVFREYNEVLENIYRIILNKKQNKIDVRPRI